MKFCFYTNSVSPHQLPLARELIARLGENAYRYVYTMPLPEGRKRCGWSDTAAPWLICAHYGDGTVDEMLESCEVLMCGLRALDLFEKRAAKGLKTFYVSERWFKPVSIGVGRRCRCSVPGWVRLFVPSYRKMAKKFVAWVKSDPNSKVLAIGPWAKKDFLRIGVPVEKIVPWGYFVAPSDHKTNLHCQPQSSTSTSLPLKILWVGRMLHWKRVDTIIRAFGHLCETVLADFQLQLTLVGDGPEKSCLQALSNRTIEQSNNRTITFLPSQPIGKIREIMRGHDVYVLASDAQEGWGAALNEALEEGMYVIGTREAGASATMLSDDDVYSAGDWQTLAAKLIFCARLKNAGSLAGQGIGGWSVAHAAQRLLQYAFN